MICKHCKLLITMSTLEHKELTRWYHRPQGEKGWGYFNCDYIAMLKNGSSLSYAEPDINKGMISVCETRELS